MGKGFDIRTEAFCDIILPLFLKIADTENDETLRGRNLLKKAMHDAGFFLENSCSGRVSEGHMTKVEEFLYGDDSDWADNEASQAEHDERHRLRLLREESERDARENPRARLGDYLDDHHRRKSFFG